MSNERDHAQDLDRILDGIAESIATESDEAILEELRAEGTDPAANAAALKAVLLGALKQHEQGLLSAARERIRLRTANPVQRTLPVSADERRTLLLSLFGSRPKVAEMVTAHCRDLSALTDADVESCLEDLAELGLLGEPPEREG